MIKNNLKVLLIYILMIFVFFIIMLGLNFIFLGSLIELNNVPAKIFFATVYLLMLIICGKSIGVKSKVVHDFTAYFLVFIIGLWLMLFSYLPNYDLEIFGSGMTSQLPALTFLSPYYFIASLLNRDLDLVFYLVLSLVNALIIGLTASRTRAKFNRRKKLSK